MFSTKLDGLPSYLLIPIHLLAHGMNPTVSFSLKKIPLPHSSPFLFSSNFLKLERKRKGIFRLRERRGRVEEFQALIRKF